MKSFRLRCLSRIHFWINQAKYQVAVVEFEGNIANRHVSILIDPSASLSYFNSKIVKFCHLQSYKFKNPWLFQLVIGAKRRVIAKIKGCPVETIGQ